MGQEGNGNALAIFIMDRDELEKYVRKNREDGKTIVFTDGTYDGIHIGHLDYLRQAKLRGDILIVGLDSDEKVKKNKGPERPLVPFEERVMMLRGLRPVDVVTIKGVSHAHWEIVKLIRPDVIVRSSSTKEHSQQELDELKGFCGEVVVLPPQAETSTSAKLRAVQIGMAEKLAERFIENLKLSIEEVMKKSINDLIGSETKKRGG